MRLAIRCFVSSVLTGVLIPAFSTAYAQATIVVQPGESIQAAVDGIALGGTVLVQSGTYAGFDFRGKAVTVVSEQGPLVTFLSSSVVALAGESKTSVVQGFDVTGFRGIYAEDFSSGRGGAPLAQDCILHDYNDGGVVGRVTAERCVIYNNSNTLFSDAAGVSGAATLRNCLVARNIGPAFSGIAFSGVDAGVPLQQPMGSATDCVFAENRGIAGPATAVSEVASLERCVIVAQNGEAIESRDPATPCTVTSCTILGTNGTAILGNCVVRNSILVNNRGLSASFAGGPAPTFQYCDTDVGVAGIGNFQLAPLFVDADNRDLHLSQSSPCIDTGDPALTDPDGTRSDVGAFFFQELYWEANTRPSSFLDPSWPQASLRLGGKHRMRLASGASHAGETYAVLGSFSGTSPGFTVNGVFVPLNPDSYTSFSFANPNGAPLSGFQGSLDALGRGVAMLQLAPGSPAGLAGAKVDHAFGIFGSSGVVGLQHASNALALELVP